MLQAKRYSILASTQAILGGISAVVIIALYQFDSRALQNSSLSMAVAILGGLTLLYYFSLHQFVRKNHPRASAIAMSLLSTLTILLIIASSGGLDSPYYSLWLLAIVAAGFFGRLATILVLVATLSYYGVEFAGHNFNFAYATAHLAQAAISVATALMAEWIQMSIGRSLNQKETIAQLSGQLNVASLKTEVLMNSVGEGIVVVDLERKIQLFNPAAAQLTGWDVDTAHNIDYRLVLGLHRPDGNKIDDSDDPLLQCFQQGKSIHRDDLTMETKGGHQVALSLYWSPILDDTGQISGGIGLFRDISAEKEVTRQKDEFISTGVRIS